jgi:maleate cis-trans isomerase
MMDQRTFLAGPGAVLLAVPLAAEVLLISGMTLPTAGLMQRPEDTLDKVVVTGQPATSWQARHIAGVDARVPGYSRLLSDA